MCKSRLFFYSNIVNKRDKNINEKLNTNDFDVKTAFSISDDIYNNMHSMFSTAILESCDAPRRQRGRVAVNVFFFLFFPLTNRRRIINGNTTRKRNKKTTIAACYLGRLVLADFAEYAHTHTDV